MNVNPTCPFCHGPCYGPADDWVVQKKFRNQLWKQYFHRTCYLKNTIGGAKDGVSEKSSNGEY